ncbi:insulin-degrading enzyme-like [Temnothorax nylanderi]|uniref:insulin-degrading enzyme-like n=1 Tax=Temnothorax nylanderi TaxID=102681 RepID=UPI003A884C84
MIFHFVSPFAYMDPLSSNLTNVFVELLHESLNEYTHIANLAGLKLEITSTIYGIKMTIDGYDDHAFVLLEKSMDQMINFKIDPKWFETLKYKIKCRNFDDIELNTVNYLEMLLAEQHWLNNELLESIAPLRADRSLCDRLIKLFIPKLFSKMYVECLIYGNVTKDEAKGIGKLIKSMLKTKELPIVPLLQNQLYREIKLKNGCYIRFEEENKVQKTSSTIVYYAIGLRTTKSNMLLSLLNQIIEEPCYNTLRTTESLGYTVFSKICTIMMNGMQYLTVAVQGGYQPRYVEKRIDSFMKDMFKHISTMPKEKFNNHKKSLDSLYLKAPDTITSQGSLYWKEIESQAYNFNRVNIEKEHLKTITQKQLLQFFKKNILINTRRKLSVHVMPTAMAVERNLPDTARRITVTSSDNKIKKFDNLMSFKLSQKK